MKYFWLNQKEPNESNFYDDIGEVYHYRGGTPGANQISEDDRFVYYRPGEYVIFGTGTIDHIEQRDRYPDSESKAVTDYVAHIRDYQPFDPPIRLKGIGNSNVKNKISFLKDKRGLNGVPQHSIHQISKKDFYLILESKET
jgi:hypothetical protein